MRRKVNFSWRIPNIVQKLLPHVCRFLFKECNGIEKSKIVLEGPQHCCLAGTRLNTLELSCIDHMGPDMINGKHHVFAYVTFFQTPLPSVFFRRCTPDSPSWVFPENVSRSSQEQTELSKARKIRETATGESKKKNALFTYSTISWKPWKKAVVLEQTRLEYKERALMKWTQNINKNPSSVLTSKC